MTPAFPSLSVIIPSRNQGQFIERTIRSILQQDYPGTVEVIVSDGGSTDETVAILQRYADRLTWWSAPDEGFVDAVMKGAARATGEILAIQSSDDYYLPGAFRAMAAAFQQHPAASFVSGGDYAINLAGIVVGCGQPAGLVTPRSILFEYIPSQHTTFLKRSFWEAVGGMRHAVDMCADIDLWYRVAHLAPGYYLPRMLAVYQLHPTQRTVTSDQWVTSLVRMVTSCEAEPRYGQLFRLTPAERRDLYAYWEIYWTSRRDARAVRPLAFARLPRLLSYGPRTRRAIVGASLEPVIRQLLKKLLPAGLLRRLRPAAPVGPPDIDWWQQ